MDSIVYENLNILWDYMCLNQHIEPAACIIGFGCINDDIAVHCAKLYQNKYAPKILFTGGLGRNTLGRWSKCEAEHFADIAIAHGVPSDAILLEIAQINPLWKHYSNLSIFCTKIDFLSCFIMV